MTTRRRPVSPSPRFLPLAGPRSRPKRISRNCCKRGRGVKGVVSRKLVVGLAVGAAVLAMLTLAGIYRPDRAIRVATGLVAHNVCSKTFVSGLDPPIAFAETIDRSGVRLLGWGLQYQLDRAGKTIEASLAGLFGSRAAFHDEFGCVVLHGSHEPYRLKSDVAVLKTPKEPPLLAEIAGPAVVEPSDPRLKAALDHAFEEH